MTRSQALTIGVLAGFVVVVFMAMIVLLFINPIIFMAPPTPTPVPPSPTATVPPTLPIFLPTPGPTSTLAEPTATNTRVPTVTSVATKEPSPTVVFLLPTRRPTATPIVPTATIAPATDTPIAPTPTFPPRRYKVSFEAEDSTIIKGECTNLKWEVVGAIAVTLDEDSIEPEGKKEVCPDKTTEYKLAVQFPDQARIERQTVKITVEQETQN